MSASFFDLMKYARTGIASPDMAGFDKLRARAAFGGYPVSTITGVPPISFKSDGKPLTAWSIAGNMVQTGTPTPDAPIMPDFCGVRTGNLFDVSTAVFGKYIDASGVEQTSSTGENNHSDYIPISAGAQYTLAETKPSYNGIVSAIAWYTISKAFIQRDSVALPNLPGRVSNTFTAPANATFAIINFYRYPNYDGEDDMLNTGTTALPYEPYGWKIPITCAGQTTPVYLGQVSTVRRIKKLVLTGQETWTDHASQANVFVLSGVTDYMYAANASGVCTHYPVQVTASATGINDKRFAIYVNQNQPSVRSTYIKDTSFNTANELKAYLAQQYANGAPVTIWYVLATPQTGIVNEPLCKIGDYADELRSTEAGVTIPTAKGANTLTVDTTLQPSAVSVTGNIKPS